MTPAAIKAPISSSVLEQIDVRVGTIERVDALPSSRKLVKLTVDFAITSGASSRASRASARTHRSSRAGRRSSW